MEKPALAAAVATLAFFVVAFASRGGAPRDRRAVVDARATLRSYVLGLAGGAGAIVIAAIVLVGVVAAAMPNHAATSELAKTCVAIAAGAVASLGALAIGSFAVARGRTALADGPSSFSSSIEVAARASATSSLAGVPLVVIPIAIAIASPRLGSNAFLAGFAFGTAIASLVARAPGAWRGEARSEDARDPSHAIELATLDASIGGGRCGALVALIGATLAGGTIAASSFGRVAASSLESAGVEAREVAALPIVIASFSAVAVVAGGMAVKARDDESAIAPMARGLHVAAPLALLGAMASTHWIVRVQSKWFAAAAALGVIGAYASALVARADAERSSSPDPLRRALPPTLAIAATIGAVTLGAHRLGAASGLPGGGAFAVALAAVGFVSLAPVVASFDVAPSIARGAARLASLAVAGDERGESAPVERGDLARIAAIEDVGAWTIVLHAGGATVVASFVLVTAARRGVDASLLPPLLAALVGAIAAVGVLALLARARERSHDHVVEELRRALEGVPSDDAGKAVFPLDFHADARAMLGRIAQSSSAASLGAIALVLVAAVGAAVLRATVAGDAPSIAIGAAAIVGVMEGVAFDVASLARGRRDELGVGLSLHVAVAALAGGALLFVR